MLFRSGSENNNPKDIEKIFSIAKVKQGKNSISLIVFDELGLSELSPSNPLKVLHSELEIGLDPNEINKKVSFIGISNWLLDALKMNRCIFLALPDFKINDIYEVVRPIDENYGNNLYYNNKDDFNKLIKIYHEYKYKLNDIKNNEFISNYH